MSAIMEHQRAGAISPQVLILIATNTVGGPGKNLLNFLSLANDREQYALCGFARRSMGEGDFIRTARQRDLAPRVLEERFPFDPRTVAEALRAAREVGAEVVQSHEYKSHTVAYFVSRRLGIPWVAFAHGWTRENRKVELFHSIDRLLLKRATQVVAVSPALASEVARLRRGRPTDVILNGIDAAEIPRELGGEALRQKLDIDREDIVIGAVGRLSQEKGQEVLLRAFASIRARLPRGRLLLVGDGPDRAALEALAWELGIADRTRFAGFQRATADYYEAMDLLVLPSHSEGLPNAVLEAMVLRTPVLATRVGGVGEIITHGENGWLVEPGRPEEMGRQLLRLSDRQELKRFGERACRSLFPKFDPVHRAGEIAEMYQRVAGKVPNA